MTENSCLRKQPEGPYKIFLNIVYVVSWILFLMLFVLSLMASNAGVNIPPIPPYEYQMGWAFAFFWLPFIFLALIHVFIVSLKYRGKRRLGLIILSVCLVGVPYGYRYYLSEKYGMFGCVEYHPKPSILFPYNGRQFCDPGFHPE